MKRVLDLSPERMAEVAAADPSLAAEMQDWFGALLSGWKKLAAEAGSAVLGAVGEATGCREQVEADAHYNFRMVC